MKRYFKVDLFTENYETNPIITKARVDTKVVCNTSSTGECAFISMDNSSVKDYPNIEKFEDLNLNNSPLYTNCNKSKYETNKTKC